MTTDAETQVTEADSFRATIAALERELALVKVERDTMEAQAEGQFDRAEVCELCAEAATRRADEAEEKVRVLTAALEGEQARSARLRGRLARVCWYTAEWVHGPGVWSRTVIQGKGRDEHDDR